MKIIIIAIFLIFVTCKSNLKNKITSLFEYNFKKTADNFKFKSEENLKLDKYSNNNLQSDLSSQTIHKGWLKYLEINEDFTDVPSYFNKNKVYYLQMSQNYGLNTLAKDNIGYVNIPNEDTFYVELTTTSLNIYTGRNDPYKKLEKSLNLNDLLPESNLSPYTGGIEDVGNFSEGYCFMLKFVNYSRHYIWELCSDSIYQKDRWISKIVEAKTKVGSFTTRRVSPAVTITSPTVSPISFSAPVLPAAPALSVFPAAPVARVGPTIASVSSVSGLNYQLIPGLVVPPPPSQIVSTVPAGYHVIGIWSECSKPCGEGVQVRPLDCMDENLCIGKKFEQRLCNIQACKENVEIHLEKLKKVANGQWEHLGTWSTCSQPCGGGIKTIERRCITGICTGESILTQNCNTFACTQHQGIDPKTMVISAFKREAFEECKFLEGNLMMVVNNEKVLSHVEVNMQSVQIYSQNNPNIPIILPLSKVAKVGQSVAAPGCFQLGDTTGKMTFLCPVTPAKGISCDEWIRRILDFKHNCSNKILNKFQTEIASSLELSKNPEAPSIKMNLLQDKVLADEKLHSRIRENVLESQFEEFKRQTRDLLAKEDIYESKLEQQERERVEWEQKKMKENVIKEQMIGNKIINDIQTIANSDSTYAARDRAIKREMKTMMDEVQSKINEKREKLISKLERMKTLRELEERKTAKELLDMKREMGKKLSKITNKGNPSQCFTKNLVMIENYCSLNFKDFDMQIECKKEKQFCYMCCGVEIGSFNKDYLNCCYNKCDEISNNQCFSFNENYHIIEQQVAFLK